MHMLFARNPSARRGVLGLSLVELLVAMAISLVVLLATTNIYLSTKANARLQSGMARINENSQISAELIAREIRVTSHMGCPALGEAARGFRRLSRDSIDDSGGANSFNLSPTSVVRVFAADASISTYAVTGSPVIDVVHAAGYGVHLSAATTSRTVSSASLEASTLFLRGDSGVRPPATASPTDSYASAIISDCATAEVFQVTSASNNPWSIKPFNRLRTIYSTDARVMPVARTQYFLGQHTRPADERGTLAIFKRTTKADGYNWNDAEPIIHDVLSIDVKLENDTDGLFTSDDTLPWNSPPTLPSGAPKFSGIVGLTISLVHKTPQSVSGTAGQPVKRTSTATVGIRARTT
jgi:hypothetical protein